MAWPYEYTPYIWPVLGSALLFAVLGVYAFRHRTVPGALPFVVLMVGITMWVLANALGLAATDDKTRAFWFKFEAALLLPLINAALCFALEYAGLGKWLTRRTLVLLSIAPLLFVLLILTNDVHHLVWTRIRFDGKVHVERGPANWWAVYYGYFLTLLHLMVLSWLFARSPRHRWIAAALIITPFIMRGTFLFSVVNWNPVAPLKPMVVGVYLSFLPYALAFFRFHMFNVVPVARDTIIERMPDGMMVLDAENRIADLNAKARALLGMVRSKAIGDHVADFLHAYPELLRLVRDAGEMQCEVFIGDADPRWYQVHISPFIDRRGFQLGRFMRFHDITELKRVQRQLLDHQRTLAMLDERELLAREIHDGVGQTLAAAHLQAKSAIEFLARGDTRSVEACLKRLAESTQERKDSVRDFLLGVKSRFSTEQSLMPGLRRYLDHYSHNYGIHVEFITQPELEEKRIDLSVETQLQPIIQEALTNVRKHSGARSARVIFALSDNRLRVAVEDDGRGFDHEETGRNQGFGLQSMRGRADAVGARLEVNSAPGKGTRVIFEMPWRKEEA
jgi:PAS domain S-box-containing protein